MSVGTGEPRALGLVMLLSVAACTGSPQPAMPPPDSDAGAGLLDADSTDAVDATTPNDGGAAMGDESTVACGPLDMLVSTTTAGPGEAHTSPSIAAGGVGKNVLVAFDDTDEDLTLHAVGWARSTDDGATFTDENHFPDPPQGDVTDNYGYPAVARDAVIGNIYVASLGSGPTTANAIAFYVSANAGVTFDPPINAADPNLAAADYIDFPAIAVDNSAGDSQGLVYVAYADFVNGGSSAVKLRLSTYGNHAFAVTEVVSPALGSGDEASLPSVAVAPNHDVLIAYYSQVSGMPGVSLTRSEDQGQHFDAPVVVAPLHMAVDAGSFNGPLGLRGTGPDGGVAPVNAYASPQIAANPVSGAIYVVYVDAAQNDAANIYFTQSADHGETWSTPLRVNDDATTNDQFLPAIAVSPDGSRIAVDFYDRRDDPSNVLANRYGSTAVAAGSSVTFSPNYRLSPASFAILVGSDPYLAPAYFAVRSSMVADSAYFYDAYADTRDGHLDVRLSRYGIGCE